MKRLPCRKRARLWAGLYVGIFGADDATGENPDAESEANRECDQRDDSHT